MYKKYLLHIIISLVILGCNEKSSEKETSTAIKNTEQKVKKIKPKQEKITTKKEWDSITSKTAIDFLIAYHENRKESMVLVKTRMGNIKVSLYNDTPLHRANFLFLSEVGYFNHTCFHRVVPNFIVQGGNSERPQALYIRNKYENYTIPPEFRGHRKHKYGAIAAAREWEDNPSKKSNPFEFYFIQAKEGAHHLDGEHTVFGEVISGFDVLDKLAHIKTGRDQWPLQDVYMEIEVIK